MSVSLMKLYSQGGKGDELSDKARKRSKEEEKGKERALEIRTPPYPTLIMHEKAPLSKG